MKVVLSGSTGNIGGEVLTQCLNHPSITSILILTRRDPGNLARSPKAKVIVVKDFTAYDEDTVSELKTADAAIWCLGTFDGDERVDIEFPLAFINIIKSRPRGSTPFRYIQLSGAFVEPPPPEGQEPRTLWYYTNGRRVRGAAEARVMATTDESPQSEFTVYVVKPGGALPQRWAFVQKCLLGESLAVNVAELGAVMADLAVHGNEQKLFYNRDIIKHGRELLEKST